MNIPEQFSLYQQNMTDGMESMLAEELGVSVGAIHTYGDVGFMPGHLEKNQPKADMAWIFPERSPINGDIIGIMRRFPNGKKFCVEGSKHGLYFTYNQNSETIKKRYSPGKHNWMRVDDSGYPVDGCPVCGRKKYCLVSRDNPENPPAVLCTKKKSRRRLDYASAWLHILDAERNACGEYAPIMKRLYPNSPILIVEGASDFLAGLSIEFDTIGKFSNVGGMELLKKLPISKQDVWVLGENDQCSNGDWPGKDGMDKTYLNLKGICNVTRVMPPEGIKDLRSWLQRGLTHDELTQYVEKHGEHTEDLGPNILKSDIASDIAKTFLDAEFTHDKIITLKYYHGGWYFWNGKRYEEMQTDVLRGRLYAYLSEKKFIQTDGKGNEQVRTYKPTRAKLGDILDACNQWCPVQSDPPIWLASSSMPDPVDLISFNNGILDVRAYLDGKVVLHDPNPNLFNLTNCPYDFDENANSAYTSDFLSETYNRDEKSIKLVWEWIGYLLTADTSQEKLMIMLGEPRSGKGTILDMIYYTLGGDGPCAATTLSNLTSQFGLEPLLGTQFCSLGDLRNPNKKTLDRAMELILPITGSDPMPVNRKGIRGLPLVRLKTRFTMAMNELPAFTDNTRAFESRLLTLHHINAHVDDADPRIKAKIIEEAKQGRLINHALQGLKRLRENNGFTTPDSHAIILKQFRAISAPVSTFIQDCLIIGDGLYTSSMLTYAAWCGWCRANSRKPGLPEQFSKWLIGHVPTAGATRMEEGGKKIGVYTGIDLTDWAVNKYVD